MDDKILTDFIFLCVNNKLDVRINHSKSTSEVFRMTVHDKHRMKSIGVILHVSDHPNIEQWIVTLIDKIERDLKKLKR